MTRTYARAARGQRVHDTVPGGHWKMLTILGAMDHTGMLAAMTVEAATDREVFLAYLDEVLCPKLRPGHVVVMDNLSAHKVDGVRQRIEARGASVLYLPPYSPDLNPIEKPGPSSNRPCAQQQHDLQKLSNKPSLTCSQPSQPKTRPHGSECHPTSTPAR